MTIRGQFRKVPTTNRFVRTDTFLNIIFGNQLNLSKVLFKKKSNLLKIATTAVIPISQYMNMASLGNSSICQKGKLRETKTINNVSIFECHRVN